MSKQLAIAAAFCTFAMAAFAATNGPAAPAALAVTQTGAMNEVTAPAVVAIVR